MVAVSLQAMPPGSPVRISNVSYASVDGGRTWRSAPAPNEHHRVHGDDAVTIAGDGTAYHSYIAFDGIRVPRPDRASSGIFVRTSPGSSCHTVTSARSAPRTAPSWSSAAFEAP